MAIALPLLAQHPSNELARLFLRQRAAALRRRRHRRIAPMRLAAQTQLSLEHPSCARLFAVAIGDLMKRRCEERFVYGMTEHAVLSIDQLAGLRFSESRPSQRRSQRTGDSDCKFRVPRVHRCSPSGSTIVASVDKRCGAPVDSRQVRWPLARLFSMSGISTQRGPTWISAFPKIRRAIAAPI